jgi:hypothetical protein
VRLSFASWLPREAHDGATCNTEPETMLYIMTESSSRKQSCHDQVWQQGPRSQSLTLYVLPVLGIAAAGKSIRARNRSWLKLTELAEVKTKSLKRAWVLRYYAAGLNKNSIWLPLATTSTHTRAKVAEQLQRSLAFSRHFLADRGNVGRGPTQRKHHLEFLCNTCVALE